MRSIKSCIVIAALCCMLPAMAQKNFGSARYTHMCSYLGEDITGDITAYEAGTSAQNVVKNIMSVIGLKANFELRAANVPNAAAVMLNNKRFILYNPAYMNKINGATGSNWAAISIFAHEIGHHLNGHTLDNVGSRPQTELDADEFSGFVLRKMGASLEDAQAVMTLIASLKGSHSHPPKKDRLAYIANGWNNAGPGTAVAAVATPVTVKTDTNPYITPAVAVNSPAAKKVPAQNTAVTQKKTTVQNKNTAVKRATLTPKKQEQDVDEDSGGDDTEVSRSEKIQRTLLTGNVKSDAHFDADPSGKYYLTAKGNLVQVEGDKVYHVANMFKSDKRGYTIMFVDADAHKIYVGTGGALVDNTGAKVGYIKAR